ncbi:MAG: hypothetical protein ACUVR4_05350 [Anaerolineae bacterium]
MIIESAAMRKQPETLAGNFNYRRDRGGAKLAAWEGGNAATPAVYGTAMGKVNVKVLP